MSEEYEEGYKAYYEYEGSNDDCPYSYTDAREKWEQWCDGNMAAYCEAEGK